jgi:hypothetical protein
MPESQHQASLAYTAIRISVQTLRWLGLSGTATSVLRWAQPLLQTRVLAILDRLPDPGLFDPEPNVEQFSVFCRHVLATLETSPRSEALRVADRQLAHAYESNAQVRWLFDDILHCGHQPHLLRICEQMPRLDPGQLYQQWLSHSSFATTSRFTPELLDQIRDGMKRKNPNRSASDIEQTLQRIVASDAAERTKRLEQADELWPHVLADQQYQTWLRAKQAFDMCGAAALEAEYKRIDQNVGHGRRHRGSAFEELAHAAFLLLQPRFQHVALSNVLQPNTEQHANASHSIVADRQQASISYVTGAKWIDATGGPVGELDLVLLCGTTVVALVEFKSNCYELAAAERQHMHKMLGRHCIECADGTRLELRHRPEFFVATLIPGHEYLLGAEARIIAALTEAFFSEELDIDDTAAMQALMLRIREQLSLASSPQQFLLENRDHVLVLV